MSKQRVKTSKEIPIGVVLILNLFVSCEITQKPDDLEVRFKSHGDLTSDVPQPIAFGFQTKNMNTVTFANLELCDASDTTIIVLATSEMLSVTANQYKESLFAWTGRRNAVTFGQGRTLPIPPGSSYLRIRLLGNPDVVSPSSPFYVQANLYDRDGDDISDAVEYKNAGSSTLDAIPILDQNDMIHYDWFSAQAISLPPLISVNIPASNGLYTL